jgi:hypothetical protein
MVCNVHVRGIGLDVAHDKGAVRAKKWHSLHHSQAFTCHHLISIVKDDPMAMKLSLKSMVIKF